MAFSNADHVEHAFSRAREYRTRWEGTWRDCYYFTQPSRQIDQQRSTKPQSDLFDSTAADGVEQLAASLLSELTPPWSRWFSLQPGIKVSDFELGLISKELDAATQIIQSHFDRSNFAVEMHQCLLDLAITGTATLLFEEEDFGKDSAFRFCAIPTNEIYLSGNPQGQIKNQFRTTTASLEFLRSRYPSIEDWSPLETNSDGPQKIELLEAVFDRDGISDYWAIAHPMGHGQCEPMVLQRGQFLQSPFITFRWMKSSGEIYGRSPVMNALPDIKTANKVVELILKNASIAVTGIWMAEDDGVLNPSNIKLIPGSIIPKASGSSGLTPLQSPGRLDVSELVLSDLRSRIRAALFTDRLGTGGAERMTATEVIERSTETARLLGAIYGRFQAELLRPLVVRAMKILARRGQIPDLRLDGDLVDIQYLSPLARLQANSDVRNVSLWLDAISKIPDDPRAGIDRNNTIRWMAEKLGVPGNLMTDPAQELIQSLEEIAVEELSNEKD